jgi:hypothetical protein
MISLWSVRDILVIRMIGVVVLKLQLWFNQGLACRARLSVEAVL